MANAKVRLLTPRASISQVWQAGDVISVPPAEAKRMVEAQLAEYVNEKRSATNSKRETRG